MQNVARVDGCLGSLGSDLVSITHTMTAYDLFHDDALARLIDRHPRQHMALLATPSGKRGPARTRRHGPVRFGGTGTLTGRQVLDALKLGTFRLELRDLEQFAPEYGNLVETGFEDIERATPRLRIRNCHTSLVISSPGAAMPCRAAYSAICKWQIRGHQRLHLYGSTKMNPLTERQREALCLASRTARVSFVPERWPDGLIYGLRAGMAVSWPLNMPHRIENEEELSVAIVSEFATPQTMRTRDVYLANGLLRRHLGVLPRSTRADGVPGLMKRGLAAATGLWARSAVRPDPAEAFVLDPGLLDPSSLDPAPAPGAGNRG